MMDDRGWFWRWWTDDGPLPHGGCWWPEEQWALGDYLLLNQNTAILWFTINISCSWNAGSGAKVWFGWLGWITKVVPSCFSETNSNVFAANLHLFHQQEKMQWVPFLAISSFKSLGSSNWSPVFNKYKNANSKFKYKYKNARRTITCNILPQKPRIMRLISCLGQTSSHTFFASTSNLNQMRFGEGQWLLYHLNLFVSFKGKKMYIYVQIFIKYEDWRPLILRRYDSNSKFQFKFMSLLCV